MLVPPSLSHKVLSVDPTIFPHLQLNHNKRALHGCVFSLVVKVVRLVSGFERDSCQNLSACQTSLAQ